MLQNGNKKNMEQNQNKLNLLISNLDNLKFEDFILKSKIITKFFIKTVKEFKDKLIQKVQNLQQIYFHLHLISSDISETI